MTAFPWSVVHLGPNPSHRPGVGRVRATIIGQGTVSDRAGATAIALNGRNVDPAPVLVLFFLTILMVLKKPLTWGYYDHNHQLNRWQMELAKTYGLSESPATVLRALTSNPINRLHIPIDRSNPFNSDGTVDTAAHLHQRAGVRVCRNGLCCAVRAGGHATLVVVTNSSPARSETLAAQGMAKFSAKCGV